jgi:hypothetical protein
LIHGAAVRGITGVASSINVRSSPIGSRRLGSELTIVGLSPAAERETRVRVQAALQNSGVEVKAAQLEVTLSSRVAGAVIDGTGFDLPIALAIATDTMPGGHDSRPPDIDAAAGVRFQPAGAVAIE